RDQRFVLGQRIEQGALGVYDALVEAAKRRDRRGRVGALRRADETLEKLRHHVRMARDLGFTAFGQYEYAAGRMDEIGRLLGGWLAKETGTVRGDDAGEQGTDPA
ncbi:four helix bundle protein, partial [Deferrisoma sp.]